MFFNMGIGEKPRQAACKKRGFSECFALVLNPSKYVNLCGCGARISGDTADVAAKVTLCNIQPVPQTCCGYVSVNEKNCCL